MNNPRFIDQYNKIVGAYLRDELRPMDSCACFVGNLMNGRSTWRYLQLNRTNAYGLICLEMEANNFYTAEEVCQLEEIFMHMGEEDSVAYRIHPPDYEDRLYRAMERALLYLRQLHESKGEVIEGYKFRKRELA